MWKVMFGCPIIFYTIMLIGLFTFITEDSPKFLLIKKKRKEVDKMLRKIYKKKNNITEISEYLLGNS